MQVKITLSDGTTVKTEMKTTKRNVLNQYPIGTPIQVLGIYMNITKVEFPSLKLDKTTLKAISESMYKLGDYFNNFSEFEDKLDEIISPFGLHRGTKDEVNDNIPILNDDDEMIENLLIHYAVHLTEKKTKPLEIIKYNCLF